MKGWLFASRSPDLLPDCHSASLGTAMVALWAARMGAVGAMPVKANEAAASLGAAMVALWAAREGAVGAVPAEANVAAA